MNGKLLKSKSPTCPGPPPEPIKVNTPEISFPPATQGATDIPSMTIEIATQAPTEKPDGSQTLQNQDDIISPYIKKLQDLKARMDSHIKEAEEQMRNATYSTGGPASQSTSLSRKRKCLCSSYKSLIHQLTMLSF
jgi:hypothetical protein